MPACSPATRSRACACGSFDGSYHSVDSSEIAFKLAGIQAMSQALELADPVLLEPIMLVTLSVPEACVGDVIGDLNSRRGRPQGMEPVGSMTEIKAEVPMAEMLTYAPDLRSITRGQGDYTLEFLRYEEVPAQLAQKIVEQASEDERPPTPETPGERPPRLQATLEADGNANDRHLPARRRLRRVRAAAAARRAARRVPRRRTTPHGMRAVRPARHPRGLAARERRAGRHPAPAPRPPRPQPARPSAPGRQAGTSRSRRKARKARKARTARPTSCSTRVAPPVPAARRRLDLEDAELAELTLEEPHAPAPAPASYSEQAVEVFNAGEFPRRVAGVARSLGVPEVSVRSAEHLASVVRSSSRGSSAGTATRSTSARRPSRLA